MNEFIFFTLKVGFLGLLWIFVLCSIVILYKSLPKGRDNLATPWISGKKFPPSGGAKMVTIKTECSEQKIPIKQPRMLIGRSPDCQIALSDRFSSGHHAELVLTESGWKVRDLGSSNGTFVDGKRIPSGQAITLRIGEELKIGSSAIRLS